MQLLFTVRPSLVYCLFPVLCAAETEVGGRCVNKCNYYLLCQCVSKQSMFIQGKIDF